MGPIRSRRMDWCTGLQETEGVSPTQMSRGDGRTTSGSDRKSRDAHASVTRARRALADYLDQRRVAIEDEIRNRIESVADTSGVTDPEYAVGLRASIGAALDYALSPLTCSERHLPDVPAVVLTQVRVAARNGVRLEAIMRRCSAYRTVVKKVLIEVAVTDGLVGDIDLPGLIRAEGALFERLMENVADTYSSEERWATSHEMRQLSLVRGLLAGESVDASELGYELSAFHTAAIVRGAASSSVVKGLASALDCVVLTVKNGDGATWAWLGRREPPPADQIERLVDRAWPATVSLALGEPSHGLDGWRRSHQQASAAFPVALHAPGRPVRYADDPLLFSVLRDEVLSSALHQFYLAPLSVEHGDGLVLRNTLRAYFAATRNGSSAASALKVSRQTINNRLKVVEGRLGRTLDACAGELEVALRLAELAE